jgi:rod shape-determining protein MreC
VRKWIVPALLALIGAGLLLVLPIPALNGLKDALREALVPFQSAGSVVGTHARELAGEGLSPAALEARRRSDRRIAELEMELQSLRAVQQENERLRESLAFASRRKGRTLAAEVVGRGDITGWWQTVRINRGAQDGVRPNSPVVTPMGLIGRTLDPGRAVCDVLLLTDETMRVGVHLKRSGVNGIVRGMGCTSGSEMEMFCAPKALRADYLPVDQDVLDGDEVETSGLGGVFPGGLRVGSVGKATVDESGLCRSATIIPCADLNALRHVFVLIE